MISNSILPYNNLPNAQDDTTPPVTNGFPTQGLASSLSAGRLAGGGGDDDPMGKEMKVLYNRSMKFDNRPLIDIVRSASQKTGVNPSMLFSSAMQEGMNKQVLEPDNVSIAYNNAKVPKDYPVDGFANYGLDTFGQRYNDLKKYLPAGFDQQFTSYPAFNEKGEKVQTAAFKNNESALMAKGAMLRNEQDYVSNYAKQKGIALDPNATNYFTLAAYNGGEGNAQKMMDEYMAAKDKSKFISEGQTTRKGVHKNIIPRLKNMDIANQLLTQNQR